MATEDVDIRIRLRGGKIAAAEAKAVAGGLDAIGRSADRSGKRMGFLKAASAGVSSTIRDIGGAARTGAFYLGALGSAAATYTAVAGLKFNATMEQNRVAFTNFLGSADAADRKLTELYELAKLTPFTFPELVEGQVRLMGFGMEAEKATGLMRTLGDAIAGAGGSSQEVKRATYAFGQMQARGKVTMEELNQLAEARIPALEILRTELGLSRKELGRIGDQGIPAGKAIDALQRGLSKRYLGEAAKQAATFNGQLSTLGDNANQTFGAIMMPAFEALRDDVFPVLNDLAEELSVTFKRTDLDFGEKMRLARADMKRELGPLFDDVEEEIRKADLGGKLASFVEMAAPKIADAAADAAPRAAESFVNAFREMGPWGKLLTVGLIAGRLGVFKVLGGRAADNFSASWGTAVGPAMGKQRSKTDPAFTKAGTRAGRLFGAAMVIGTLGLGMEIAKGIIRELQETIQGSNLPGPLKGISDAGAWIGGQLPQTSFLFPERTAKLPSFGGGGSGGPGSTIDPFSRPGIGGFPRARPQNLPRAPRAPRAQTGAFDSGPPTPIVVQTFLDKRQIGEAVAEVTRDTQNRR